MSEELQTATLTLVRGHINRYELTAALQGQASPSDLTGKTYSAKLAHGTTVFPLVPGVNIGAVNAAQGLFFVQLSAAEADTVPLDTVATLHLTIWNANDTQWGHGAFALVSGLG